MDCENLIVRPEWRQDKLSMLLPCSIPAYEEVDTTFCDEWCLERGKIVPRNSIKRRREA